MQTAEWEQEATDGAVLVLCPTLCCQIIPSRFLKRHGQNCTTGSRQLLTKITHQKQANLEQRNAGTGEREGCLVDSVLPRWGDGTALESDMSEDSTQHREYILYHQVVYDG